ncbi:syndetin-like [Portunus trituberculatus]|uniref:syndetin-like n=1 Tax=Portunus trituberculatus TaxID=210409 RepID=UPI001E1CC781|nr:syndetin-like [Portunus trituberculatus]
MDIKEKFMSFIDKQISLNKTPSSTIPGGEFVTSDDFEGRMAVTAQLHRKTSVLKEQILTPEAEQAVIDGIEQVYFEAGDVDISEHELKKFPETIDVNVINGLRSRLRKQQNIVSRRVSDLIMQKQGLCSTEMEQVMELQREVIRMVGLCVEGRRKLAQGRSQFTSASLGILANYSKRQKVASVIRSLRMIRTLQMTDEQLQTLLRAEDYPGAIQLLLECQKAAATFKHFTCISELSTKLQDTLEVAEEQLDQALARVAANFNIRSYEKLQTAYGLLGKTQTLMDQLHMHLTSHIHNSAFTIVLGYVELYNSAAAGGIGVVTGTSSSSTSSSSSSKLQYSELCKYINEESFLPCLLDLSKCMWNVLRSYRNIITWHDNNKQMGGDDVGASGNNGNGEGVASEHYIKQKLEHGLYRIWQDVQAKVRTFTLASDLAHFKFDDFLRILDVMNKLIEVGECFCGSKSETLRESIKQQSINYFRNHHRARMEELRMFLENEGWEACPVKSTFTIHQLMEYRFLKGRDTSLTRITSPTSSPTKAQGGVEKGDVFDKYGQEGSPFDLVTEEAVEEDIMANGEAGSLTDDDDESDEDMPIELKRDYVEEHIGDMPPARPPHASRRLSHSKAPIVTNTTLTILRLIGKYIQMMRLLQPIAFDVMVCLSHLFDYYLYTVFTFFGARGELEQSLSRRLRASLKRIQDTLILTPDASPEEPVDQDKVMCPSLSPVVDITSSESICGLSVRVVAVESLAFLAAQLEALHCHIEPLIPQQRRTFLQQFYTGTIKITPEIRHHVYTAVAAQAIDYDGVLSRMINVKWDINDLMSQHSQYVDILLRQLQVLSMRLEEASQTSPIPEEAYTALWESIVRITNRTLLEGFASARRCTNEGRSLMQLDYQQFLMKLECLTSVRPLPDRHLVETYIKAYYLPEGALEAWVQQSQADYSPRQLTALVATMTHVSKRSRQRIAALIEESGKKS